MTPVPKWKKAESLAAKAAEDHVNFQEWKRGPSGLSAMGFGRVTKPASDQPNEAINMLREALAKRRP